MIGAAIPIPELPERSVERAGCPTCGDPLEIRTNGLTGEITTRCPACIARTERAQFHAAFRRRAIETVARDFGLTVEEAERRLRTDPAAMTAAAVRPTEAECTQCHTMFAVARLGTIPTRCHRCRGRLARYRIRPATIACERCGVSVPVQRLGLIPKFCAACRLTNKPKPDRPSTIRCARCDTAVIVRRLGPIPTHCAPCHLINRAERMRAAAAVGAV